MIATLRWLGIPIGAAVGSQLAYWIAVWSTARVLGSDVDGGVLTTWGYVWSGAAFVVFGRLVAPSTSRRKVGIGLGVVSVGLALILVFLSWRVGQLAPSGVLRWAAF